ncbi:MAG: DUF1592 domain-containing protein [Bryobacteraceae bacterium]
MRFLSGVLLTLSATAFAGPNASQEFTSAVRPVLVENCGMCHNGGSTNHFDFLKARTAKDIESHRRLWADVVSQLRNRTMPPIATKLTEEQRLHVAAWVNNWLLETACDAGDYAGAMPVRRLNRREYENTIRDLLGVDLAVSGIFPADGSGGEGFDTNGETLYVPPLMMERYLQAARQILDRVIATPPLYQTFAAAAMQPAALPVDVNPKGGRMLAPGQSLSSNVAVYVDGDYNLKVSIERPHDRDVSVDVKVDALVPATLKYRRDPNGSPTSRAESVRLERGVHTITIIDGTFPVEFYMLTVEQKQQEPTAEKRALHYRLFGMEPGEAPLEPRRAAERLLAAFLPRAYRRPVEPAEVDRFMALYNRAAKRGDPYEERVKLALEGVLVSPRFLFRLEASDPTPGVHPLGQYDIASRLSYYLWSTMPDAELMGLAAQGRLQDSKVLVQQVDRMLDDPRSRTFTSAFVGQWLGTKDVGGRLAPAIAELQQYYTPEVAADLREEPVLLFQSILDGNRSVIELLDANYTFLTERLVRFYQLEGRVPPIEGSGFQRVDWPDNRRAGILGLGAVLAMTSHYRYSSPVLRGAWVLDTLFGTPVPPPPPDVPPLETKGHDVTGLTMRQMLERHRASPACAACHKLMDPIGFGLENFDWMGRWHDRDAAGRTIDVSGALPTGEKFSGPVELRQLLLKRKDDFVRHLTAKLFGYALGRSLQDGDQCTVQRIVNAAGKDNYRGRTLIREIVLSTPFRNSQGGAVAVSAPVAAPPPRPAVHLLGDK